MSGAQKRVLHLHSAFDPGGKELRSVALINAFGPGLHHTIVSGDAERTGAARRIDRTARITLSPEFPPLRGRPSVARYRRLAEAMRDFDLVLTYNWGAMDAVMAHTLFAQSMGLPPLIHHEDGFNQDEADGLKVTRNWFRRIGFGRTAALVVPSRGLRQIALDAWQQPERRVHRIPNGIDLDAFAMRAKPDVLPSLIKRKNECWVGTLAGLRAVKNLPRLVRAFAALPEGWQLVICGEGPESGAIRQAAKAAGVEDRVHLPGFAAPEKVVPLFDIFALSSYSEQFPISVVEAMAAGVPVVAPGVGDIATMVAKENAPFVTPAGDEQALAAALKTLADSPQLRAEVGEANRRRARAEYGFADMAAAYRRLYARALGLRDLP
ncbi:glycosyltransferase family 4 protein [Altererythrobacter sp. CAU 1778]